MSGRSRATILLTAMGLAALVAGCGTSKDIATMTCPTVAAAPGADTIAVFRPGGHDLKDLIMAAQISSATAQCVLEKPGVGVLTDIEIYVERASMKTQDGSLPYFVALVGPDQNVLTEEAFEIKFPFLPGDSYRKLPPEKHTIHLPVRNRAQASSFTVVVGFQLTPEQLAFNRARAANAP